MDFRARVSRSIWLSKLRLSCDKLLLAGGGLSFGGKVRLLIYISAGRGRGVFCRRSSRFAAFLNAAFVEGPSVLSKTRKQRSVFSELPFSAGIWVVEATSE